MAGEPAQVCVKESWLEEKMMWRRRRRREQVLVLGL